MDEILKRLIVQISYAVEPGGREKVEQDQQRTEAKSVAIGALAAGAIAKAASIGLSAVKALVGGLVDAVQGFAEFGDEVAKTAGKLGVGTTELQRLRFAAQRSGADASMVGEAFKKLAVGLDEARTKGTGPLSEGLGLVGVELRELEGLTAEQQVGLLADALNEIDDPMQRAAAAAKIFGESAGSELGPLLATGSEGIKGLGDEAERLGLVMGDAALKGAEDLTDALSDAQAQVQVTGARIGGYLAPLVTDATRRMSNWAAENRQFVEQDLPAAIESILVVGGQLLAWLADVVTETRQFGREVGFAYDRVTEWATAMRDDLQPAIDRVASVMEVWGSAILTVNEGIGKGIASLLEYIGVLDTLKAAWDALPFTGESIDELTARLHGGPKASDFFAAAARGERAPDVQGEGRAAQDSAWQAAIAAAQAVAAEAVATAAESGPRHSGRAAARDRYRASLGAKPGGGGGGGGASGPSSGDTLDRMWQSLTGQDVRESWWDRAGAAIGIGGGSLPMGGGGGGSPLQGANFSRVDASFTANTTVNVNIPEGVAELGAAHLARAVADEVATVVEERARVASEHYASTARRM